MKLNIMLKIHSKDILMTRQDLSFIEYQMATPAGFEPAFFG